MGPTMPFETIQYLKEPGIGIIRLDRPESMNAVIEEMYLEIQAVLDLALKDDGVRVMILTGTSFTKNGKVRHALKKHAGSGRTKAQKRDYILLAHETTRRIHDFPKPVVAAINGPARGAGSEMALSCDVLLMADEATIAFPETGLGTFVGGGVTRHLPLIVGVMRARELVYTGRVIDGKGAVAMGLALASFPVERLMDEARALAGLLARRAPLSMTLAKTLLHRSPGLDLETVLKLEAEAILSCMDTEDWHEGVRAFAEKRDPVFRGK
jgi:enoyl-CoA hydratase